MAAPPSTHFETLPNGLTLLLRESHLAPVVDLQIWALVGSADESDDQRGLAHFHEHMLFKGTETRGVGDVAGEIEGVGGRINAYTSFDVTVYHATLPSVALNTGVDVLVDAVRHSVFDPEEIEREIEVVIEEIHRAADSPLHVLGDAVFAEAYHVHPYRAPILGSAESVSRFDRDKVQKFYRRWYAPDNLVVIASGDFDANALASLLREAFEGAEPAGAARNRPSEPVHDGLRQVVLRQPFERVRVDLSWPAPRFADADATHLDLLSFILGECDSSRLVQRVKEQEGLVDRIDCGAYTPLDPGLFSVSIEADGARAQDALRAALREIERAQHERVSQDELDRARANFLAIEHFERESVSGQARKLGSFHVMGGDWRSESTYFDSIRDATPDDLLRVARKYLSAEQLTAGVMLPEDETRELDVAAAVSAGVADGQRPFEKPRRNEPVAVQPGTSASGGAPRGVGSEIVSYTLPGGSQLHVAPRREVPVVAGRAAFLGGLLAETEETAGIGNFLASMWLRGTRARSAADFARSVENIASEIDGFSGRSSMGLTFEVTADKLEPTLDLFAEVMTEPGFEEEELERERRDTLAALERREDRLAQRAFLLFTEALFERHPYRLPMLGNPDSVASFDAESLRAHHDRHLRAENLVLGIAGDVDPDNVASAVASRLAALPRGGFTAPAPPADPVPLEIRERRATKDRAQAHLVLGFQGLSVHDPDRHALEVMSQLLAGQGGRLFLELRDRRGLAYSVNAVNVEGVSPGFFSVYIASAPEKVEEAKAGMLRELTRLVEEPVPEDELLRARRYLSGNHVIDQQRNAAHAAHLALDGLYGLGTRAHLDYPAAIEAVTKEDLLRVARRVLKLDAYTMAWVGPE